MTLAHSRAKKRRLKLVFHLISIHEASQKLPLMVLANSVTLLEGIHAEHDLFCHLVPFYFKTNHAVFISHCHLTFILIPQDFSQE